MKRCPLLLKHLISYVPVAVLRVWSWMKQVSWSVNPPHLKQETLTAGAESYQSYGWWAINSVGGKRCNRHCKCPGFFCYWCRIHNLNRNGQIMIISNNQHDENTIECPLQSEFHFRRWGLRESRCFLNLPT